MARRSIFALGTTVLVLQIVVAAYLIPLGLLGIIYWESGGAQFARSLTRAFGGSNNPLNLIVAIVELAAGVIVLLGLFTSVRSGLLAAATLVIAILWVIQIIIVFFARDIFEPKFLVWLNRLAADLIVLLALWLINRKYA
ncbi:MAG: hypothetical protein A2V99_17615 [Spirochaetes bacterium RBG_16_67_19]|nr:MAG: hypothetical protein A2V99_17615 [Spirochaetes bacterium RBG_16_67_19]